MYKTIRPLLFNLDPEAVHHVILFLMQLVGDVRPVYGIIRSIYSVPERRVNIFGLSFKNLLGLAAGYDKDGLGMRGLASLGFGHIEIGTVTLKAQNGNPRPRLFRLPEDHALINRMGFPGHGAKFVLQRLEKNRPEGVIVGVNIGKNKDTPLEQAPGEYVTLLRMFLPAADYIAINVSSPNTAGLRLLQAREALDALLGALEAERRKLRSEKPILVKLAPDLTDEELEDSLDVILKNNIDGLIATNTTVVRPQLKSPHAVEAGGLSGSPLHAMSVNMVNKIYRLTDGKLPIIGAGGILNAADAQRMLDAGAVLVQIYTGLVYEGPGLVRRILKALA